MRRSPIETCSLHNYTGTQRCPLCSRRLVELAAENERLRVGLAHTIGCRRVPCDTCDKARAAGGDDDA